MKSIKSAERLLTQKDLDSTKSNHYEALHTSKQGISKLESSNSKSPTTSNNSLLSMKKANSSNYLN